ncbi:MAG: hypothetical protein A2W31_10865 [Planctomycetes bacterium RBG_16_64_10]|nr:MAG: hypothetical protein A2W31_10865 [Planctomycetes bacterium RBG_16_64_10]
MIIAQRAMRLRGMAHAIVVLLGASAVPCWSESVPADVAPAWEAYRGNAARSGFTPHRLAPPLSLQWVYEARHPPMSAWPRSDRMPFDRAYQPVVTQGRVVFGSSADGAVYGLDLDTGATTWVFHTDAPVRFTPAAWRDRLFVVSDDGFLYALTAADGTLLWKRRGGPSQQMVTGNGRVISKWPARGGPVVVDDTVYWAAGIWPSDRVYLNALDAASGEVRWHNDDAGALYMPQPHPTAEATSGVAAQGHLLVAGDHLLVPTGRAVPASFDRKTGRFEYFHLQKYGHQGGTPTMLSQGMFLNSGMAFDIDTGQQVATVGAGQLAATDGGLVRSAGGTLEAFDWETSEKPDRKGQMVPVTALRPRWKVDGLPDASALIVAGDHVVLGGPGQVVMVDGTCQARVWSADVTGRVYGLAAAGGMLLVSTDAGFIYGFAATARPPHAVQQTPALVPVPAPYGDNAPMAEAAAEILKRSGITTGYCVDLGCGDGRLAFELAKRSQLQIYAVGDDAQQVEQARAKLSAAGVYGPQVTVHCRPLNDTGYPHYLANLVVSARSVLQGASAVPETEASRLQRPYGGVICIGKPGAMYVAFRGPLVGGGSWTHQYANAANTLASDDQLVKGRLSMLWFREVALDLPSRHGRAPAPLAAQGRLFHAGIDGIVALDAYNGRELWRYEIPGLLQPYDGEQLMGVAGTGSKFCLHHDSLYVCDRDHCLRLAAETGELLGTLTLPKGPDGPPDTWGYLACVDGILYGTRANPEHVVTYRFVDRGGDMSRLLTESDRLFALDPQSGGLLWQYDAKDSIRHNAIAIGQGKVCLIDRPLALFDRVKKPEEKVHVTGRLMALDAATGALLWATDEDIFGTMLALSGEHGVLLMAYQPTRFRLDSEFGGRMAAYDLNTGQRLWQVAAQYHSRPMIVATTIYAQGGAWDLRTGQPQPFQFGRSYGCGILAGCPNMLLFRSATLGYRDLTPDGATLNYGGLRPGCWINALPVGGLVLVPDASAGCRCSYLNQAWIGLEPVPAGQP